MDMSFYRMLIALKNSQKIKHNFVIQKHSKTNTYFLNLLWNEGFISGYSFLKTDYSKIKIFLSYCKGTPAIKTIRLISKPGRILSYSSYQLWKIDPYNTIYIISTNEGIRSLEYCKRKGLGGILICSIN